MSVKNNLRKSLIGLTGYWIHKHRDLPIGCDLITDLKQKIRLPLNKIFDVGANVGQTALKFQTQFPAAHIYSFEPVSVTFNKLRKAVASKDMVSCYKYALGDQDEQVTIKLFDDDDSVLNSLNTRAMNAKAPETESIEVITGDSFCRQKNITEIDLLKIDTEGYELKVLQGFTEMIRGSKIALIFCEAGFNPDNPRNTYLNDIIEFTNRHGYRLYGLYEISNLQIGEGYNYGNVLFVRNDIAMRLT